MIYEPLGTLTQILARGHGMEAIQVTGYSTVDIYRGKECVARMHNPLNGKYMASMAKTGRFTGRLMAPAEILDWVNDMETVNA